MDQGFRTNDEVEGIHAQLLMCVWYKLEPKQAVRVGVEIHILVTRPLFIAACATC